MMARLGAYALIALLWLLHWLPLPLLAALGQALGLLLWATAAGRRKVVLINLALCFPELNPAQRRRLARQHFGWLGRSLLERGMLWFASERRLRRLVQVEGAVLAAEQSRRPVMWLVPHFVGLDLAGPALLLNQQRPVVDVYQRQSNPVFNAAVNAGRARFGRVQSFEREQGIRPVLRAIHQGAGFVNAPDMDFGAKDSAFVPFFGVDACTLLSPGRMAHSMDMLVQVLVTTLLPWGRGYRVRFCDAPAGLDDADPVLAARAFSLWLEARVRQQPAQYYWVHRRFKTRPQGAPALY
jgi:Kdo2-lipid IVA lauroyltransferase/acyltransferase